MSEQYGNDFLTLIDDEGEEFELEHLDTFEFAEQLYMAFLPTDCDEDDPDFGIIILKTVVEDGEEVLGSIDDDDELERVYAHYMNTIFDDDIEEFEE